MSVRKHILTAIAAAASIASGGVTGPVAAATLDMGSTLPAGFAYSRTGTRTAVVNGVVTTILANSPAFESWNGLNRGIHLQPAGSNILPYSQDQTQASYVKRNVTFAKNAVGPDGLANSACTVTSSAAANIRDSYQDIPGTIGSGTMLTLSMYVYSDAGQFGIGLRLNDQFNDNGAQVVCHAGNGGSIRFKQVTNDATWTTVEHGRTYLGNGWSRVWNTGYPNTTATRRGGIRFYREDLATQFIASDPTFSHKIFGLQVEPGYVKSYIPTPSTAVATCSADTLTLSTGSIAGFGASAGTFVIEHDLTSGTLMSLGGSALVAASAGGKLAFAWDGSGSRLVSNGGAATTGATTTVSGTITLGDTLRACHIKSINYYSTALTTAEMQALTAPVITKSSTSGAVRVTGRGVWNNWADNIGAGFDTVDVVIPVDIQGDRANLSLIYANCGAGDATTNFTDTLSDSDVLNTVYVEYNGISQPLLFGGSVLTMAANSNATYKSDLLLPSQFGVTKFSDGTRINVRQRQKYSVVNGKQVGGLQKMGLSETTPLLINAYNSATTTGSAVSGTGAFTYTGAAVDNSLLRVNSPIVVGKYVSGDTPSFLAWGDSLQETHPQGGFLYKAARAAGCPCVEVAKGGQHHKTYYASPAWKVLFPYFRAVLDGMGTNGEYIYQWMSMVKEMRDAGLELYYKFSLLPATTDSSNNYSTEAAQTVLRIYPDPITFFEVYAPQGGFPLLDIYTKLVSVRGVNQEKWLTNGSPNYTTKDGVHTTAFANDLLTAEVTPLIAALSFKEVI
jgi:hypothetical protein